MCFCKECALEDDNLVATGDIPPEIPVFHLTRAIHMVGRCIDCGLCNEACPADIPLRTLYKKVADIIDDQFQYRPGYTEGKSPLNMLGPVLKVREKRGVRLMDYKTVLTTCTYCGCGCGFYLEVLDGQVIDTIPCKTNPVSQGKLCIKGWNVHEFIQSPKRLTQPLVRKDGELVEVSWDEALDYTVEKMKGIKASHGGDALAFLTSARVTNEENYLFQKFARAAVGTNNVDHCARL
jgi:predicted molibdopterin-dependent oxidoreductase YjgC